MILKREELLSETLAILSYNKHLRSWFQFISDQPNELPNKENISVELDLPKTYITNLIISGGRENMHPPPIGGKVPIFIESKTLKAKAHCHE